ncbi:MAG: Multimodular transpeptidase-transglycosylase [uncultured Ramlibacter sp.]|uniref:Multimodular transpeptidase-transglycosylase n=1 Tax=uncultured Ramlibacter sp. TaxID=260755 RepID=A0A6J4P0I7_9BURK|nr:MAG: Multimodular transpeptidase-transglycosylase [uncultured Ramlibacter sp.]
MTPGLHRAAASSASRSRRPPRSLLRYWWVLLLVVVLMLAVPPLLAALYVMKQVPLAPTVGDITSVKNEQPSVMLTSDGKELALFRKAYREWVKLGDISPHVVAALLATEDQRFYEHKGLDLKRTIAAAVNTMQGRLQGGSTITQQLARNLYPEEIGRAPTIDRKIKEAVTALRIEQKYSKDEILEIYLNTVPFLYNAYGIEAAARTYFDKKARELNVLESATLVGMLKGTSYYNPVLNPSRAQQRRNTVLAQMARFGKLEAAELETLRQEPLRLDFERQEEPPGPAPHFSAHLRRWLIDWADRNGYNVYADGLVVRTTLDSRAQELATQAVARQSERLQKLADNAWNGRNGWNAQRDLVNAFIRESPQYKDARNSGLDEAAALAKLRADATFMQALRQEKTRLQAGFLALEPATGLVRAWVGSRDFAQDQFDHVQQARRQPGSTFKPFVYGAAFELGARSSDTLVDQPIDIPMRPGEVWRPTDMTQPSLLPMTLRDALSFSKNTITAQLMLHIGAEKVANVARAMGVRDSKLDEVPSLGLGTSLVTLKEMVSAYGTIANGGNFVAPSLVLRVEDRNGRVLEDFRPAPGEAALPPSASLVLLDALRGVIDQGTGTAIRRLGLQGDLAGKTGTTQDNTDGWFILMHPQLVAGAWVGFNDSRVRMQEPWGQGSRSALPMVGDFFQQTVKLKLIDPKARFPKPPPEISPMEQAGTWWGSVFPPQTRPLEAPVYAWPDGADRTGRIPEVIIGPTPSAEALPPGTPLGNPPPIATVPPRTYERAVVVAPPRPPSEPALSSGRPQDAPYVFSPRPPTEQAIVVAPPRPATVAPSPSSPWFGVPPGQPSGAGRAPRPAVGNPEHGP